MKKSFLLLAAFLWLAVIAQAQQTITPVQVLQFSQSKPLGNPPPNAIYMYFDPASGNLACVNANGSTTVCNSLPQTSTPNQCLLSTSTSGTTTWGACSGSASSNWSAIVPGTGSITAGTYNVPSGATITPTGTGVVNANQVNGGTMPLTKTIVGTNGSGQIADASAATLANNTTGSSAKWTTARNLAGNSVDGSANVPFANSFIVQGTADAGLSGAQFLGSLLTGVLKVTATTGVLSDAASADIISLFSGTCNSTTFLRADGSCQTAGSFTAAGDLSGSSSTQQVIGLKSVPFCTGFTPTNGQALQYTTGGSPNPCYTAVTVTGGGNVSAVGTLANATPSYGGGTTNVSTAQTYVLASAMSGSDGAAKIAAAIASATYCPNTGNNVGCIIDARDMTGTDLIWKQNPFHGNNRAVTLLLGPHTYVACYPIVSGQNGYDVFGTGSGGSIAQDSIIRAGTAADGCAGDFPNGTSQLTFSWAHGPFAAGTYAGLYNDGGTPSTDTPAGTADTFGGRLEHLRLDCNNLATCSFGYFTSTEEERSGLYDVSISGVTNACGFWDRQYQIGQNNSGGGSGPTHFGFNDVTCSQPATGATTNTVYGFVYEGNTTHITFTGVGGGSGASAYVLINSGTDNPNSTGVVLNAGSGYPNGAGAVPCTLDAVVGSGSTCSATTDGSGHVVSIAFAGSPSGTYSGAQVPGGGFSFGKATITGTASIALAAGIWSEGSYNASISGPIHTERIGTDTVLIGGGTAPYQGTRVASVDTTTGSGGNGVHFGVGATDLSYTAENIMRLISTGAVLTDDNTSTVISTTTTPTIPSYTGGTIQSGAIKTNGNGVDAGYFALGGNTANFAVTANTVGFMGPTSATFTGYALQLPSTAPSGTQYLGCGTPSSGVSTCAWGSGGSGGDTITSPNSTLTIGGTATNTTLDLVGSAGKIFAGATPALTFTPTLGISGTAGTLAMFPASGNFTTTWGSAATASNTILGFATVPTTGHLLDCTVASTTCTLHDSGIVTANAVTAASTLTTHGVALGAGTKTLSVTAVGATNTVLNGTTGADPSFGALPLAALATQTADTMVANMTAGTAAPTAVAIPTTAHGVWLGEGTGTAPGITAAGATNTVLHGNTGADPTYSAIVAGDITSATITHTQTDSTFPTLVASGTSAMGTGGITTGTCATVVTTTATGAATTDNLVANPTVDPTGVTGYAPSASGSLYIQAYITSGNVNFKVCNNTSGTITPSALTMQWRVIR